MNKYDIILIEFPYSNLSHRKLRPALVISNLKGDNIILAQITTKKRNISDFEVVLNKKDTSENIKFNSYIYLDMIFTLHKSLVIRTIGKITSEKVKKDVQDKVTQLFK